MPRVQLPEPIASDLFTATVRQPDMAMSYLSDQFEKMGYVVDDHGASKSQLRIRLSIMRNGRAVATATVLAMRTAGLFAAEAAAAGGTFLPVTGTWPDIIGYLRSVKDACLAEGRPDDQEVES